MKPLTFGFWRTLRDSLVLGLLVATLVLLAWAAMTGRLKGNPQPVIFDPACDSAQVRTLAVVLTVTRIERGRVVGFLADTSINWSDTSLWCPEWLYGPPGQTKKETSSEARSGCEAPPVAAGVVLVNLFTWK